MNGRHGRIACRVRNPLPGHSRTCSNRPIPFGVGMAYLDQVSFEYWVGRRIMDLGLRTYDCQQYLVCCTSNRYRDWRFYHRNHKRQTAVGAEEVDTLKQRTLVLGKRASNPAVCSSKDIQMSRRICKIDSRGKRHHL